MKNHFFFRFFSLVLLFPIIAVSEEEKKLGYPVTVVEQLPNNNTILKKKCQYSKDKCECSKSLSYEPQLYCVQMNIDMGRTRYSALTESVMLQLCELQPTTALYSPDGFRVVAGYAVYNVSRDKNGSGVSKWIQLVGPSGLAFSFDFAAGESVGKPMSGLANETSGRLAMVDAQGWATATDPAFYDYYPGDGSRWRFGAARNAPNYLQFVEHQTSDGRMETSRDIGLEILRDADGRLRQVATPAFLANFVVCGQDAYDLTVYPNDTTCISRTRTSEGFYEVLADAVPEVVWKFRNPSPGIPCDLDVTVEKPGTAPQIWHYQYVEAVRDFTLKFPGGMKEVRLERMEADAGRASVLRRIKAGPDGKAYWTRELHYETKAFGEVLTRTVRDPGGLNLTQYYDYYATGTTAGLERQSVLEDGSWIRYEYDDARRLMAEIRPWMDAPTNAPDNQCAVTRYSYGLFATGDFLAYNDQRPRMVINEICGVEVSRIYHAYPTNALGQALNIEERAAFPGASYGHAANPRTVKTYCAANAALPLPGRLATITYPGGKVEEYGYEYGTFNVATFAFAADPEGGAWRETVTTSYGANSSVQVLRSARVWDEKGREVLDESYVEDGAAFAIIGWKRMAYDRNGKLIETSYSDGRVESATWGANCCGKESATSAEGIITVYGYNELKQKVSETKKGLATDGSDDIVKLHEYDLGDNLLITAVTNYVSCQGYVATRNAYDAVGRITNTIDRLGNATVTSYATNGVVTVSSPNGVTTVTEHYLDGQIKRVLENGVIKQSYAYGVDFDGMRWVLSAQGAVPVFDTLTSVAACRLLAGALDFPWSLSVADSLGQNIFAEKPGFAGSILIASKAYDIAGNLLFTSQYAASPNQIKYVTLSASVYSYALDGSRLLTSLDLNTNGVIDLAGPDRVTGFASTYEKDASKDWWHVSRSWCYPEFNSALAVTTSVQRVKLTGLGVQQGNGGLLTSMSQFLDVYGNVTTSKTLCDRAMQTVTQVSTSSGSLQPSLQVVVNGLIQHTVSDTDVITTYAYDALGRQIAVTDGRSNITVIAYDQLGLVAYTEDAASNRTSYAYDTFGRRITVIDALGNVTHTRYDAEGHEVKTWGASYPVEYGYDTQGRMVSMKTFRDGNGVGDETRWLYDNPTGLMTNKLNADGKGPSYTYTFDGKLSSRLWARGVLTTYVYDMAGSLVGVDYADATPDTTYTFDRLGRQLSATSPVSTNLFAYSKKTLDLVAETQNGTVITRAADAIGRSVGLGVGDVCAVTYGYDDFGRFSSVSSSVCSVVSAANYAHLPSSNLRTGYTASCPVSNFQLHVSKTYEPNRDLITSISNRVNQVNSVLFSAYDYSNDVLGRRVSRNDSGLAFAQLQTNTFGYNQYSELRCAVMHTNTYGYVYDPVGNRLLSSVNSETNIYNANMLNQYIAVSNMQALVSNPTYDADGNMVSCQLPAGEWHYVWDAENRLACASNSATLIYNIYDYQSRRIEKTSHRNEVVTDSLYLYDGWNPIREIVAEGNNSYTNFYIWGLDLSGTFQGAGGVGGLLTEYLDDVPYYVMYDGNGNITDYVNSNGNIVAHYEYDAFGNTMVKTGSQADSFAFRFSTKKLDTESGLYYYGYRYYLPDFGRWTSSDPLGDIAFFIISLSRPSASDLLSRITPSSMFSVAVLNMIVSRVIVPASQEAYLFTRNSSVNKKDFLGLNTICNNSSGDYACKCSKGSKGKKQKGDKITDGCSAPVPNPLKDNPSGIPGCSFLPSCDAHDCCYGKCGSSKASCDAGFCTGMTSTCFSCAGWNPILLAQCLSVANTYCVAVVTQGGSAYDGNQNDFCEDCCCQ